MGLSAQRWTTVSDSSYDHEREALAFLRDRLPDREPIRAWSNFEFVARTGSLYEVDALVLTEAGLFLLELKAYPGEIGGDGTTWEWRPPGGRPKVFDSPRSLANRKAKHLADLLNRTKAIRGYRNRHPGTPTPYVQEAVFLSDPDLTVTLSPPGRFQVYGRDPAQGEELPPSRASIGGVVAAMTSLGPSPGGRPARRVDRAYGDVVAKAVAEVGIRERASRRVVGDYRLGGLLADVEADRDTGITYQDFLGEHVAVAGAQKRIRLYPLERNATTEARQAADRAARREFGLLNSLDHPGILRPSAYTDSERGPALVFDHDPDERPLHQWLADPAIAAKLTLDDRLAVVRQVAEALDHAHRRGVTHRALSPATVLVRGPADQPRARVTNWHAGARVAAGDAGTGGTTGTVHVEALAAHDAALYRAPEFNDPSARPVLLDVFSLGALAALVLTGHPPAPTPTALARLLTTSGCVPAEVLGEGLHPDLAEVVRHATQAVPAERPPSVGELLEWLDHAEEFAHLPDAPTEPMPDEARRGDTLGGGRYQVVHRLGRGATAIALEVLDVERDRTAVLKVASELAHNERIVAEAEAIRSLRNLAIVELLDGPFDLSGYTAILLSHAGRRTLAARFPEPPGLELAERLGADLLDAVRHLEQAGVSHRDIKPENIGVTKRGPNDELHLVLFDFSLARAPLDQVEAGTSGYRDPFLGRPGRARWDLHAERYSAAVTLYELLTGAKPRYGTGTAAAQVTEAEVSVDPALFDASVADGLAAFFRRALARDTADRFDTADDMLRAWTAAFAPAAEPATGTAHPPAGPAATGFAASLPPTVTTSTRLVGLPLTNRAVSALARHAVHTVGDLLAFPGNQLSQLKGVGAATRREILEAVEALRPVTRPATPDGLRGGAPRPPLGAIAAQLLPVTRRANQGTKVAVARLTLGIDGALDHWPSQGEVAESVGVTRARVSQLLSGERERWAQAGHIDELGDWVADELGPAGGVAAATALADRLASTWPAGEDGDDLAHRRAATSVVRAVLLVEELRAEPRWLLRRRGGSVVAVAVTVGEAPAARPDAAAGQALADYVTALADRADELVAQRPVVPRAEAAAALAAVPVPAGVAPLGDAQLVESAVGLAEQAATNSAEELYRRGLPPLDALRATRRSLVAAEKLTLDQVQSMVRALYPEAAPLPPRPGLDGVLAEVPLDLRWNDEHERYETRWADKATTTRVTTSLRRHPTGLPAAFPAAEVDEAAEFDRRLAGATGNGGLLVLVTEPRHLPLVPLALEAQGVTVVDLDEALVNRLDALTAGGRPSWQLVVEADAAGPGTPQWQNLGRVLDRAFDDVSASLLATGGTVALHNLGLLARYDRLGLVAAWRDALYGGQGRLGALWLVVGAPQAEVPLLDGRAVPVLDHEWARIPEAWLANRHRALPTGAASP